MQSFNDWTNSIAEIVSSNPKQDASGIHSDLLEFGIEDESAEGGWIFPCYFCGEMSPIYCEPNEWEPDTHYCGKNQNCCP